VQSTHTLVHTPRTAGRAGLVEQPPRRTRIAPLDPARAGTVVLERYRLLERLGAGGFGVVWRAHDELLGREVALKRIALHDGDSERASREALAAARLAHPSIVALYEACAAPDAFYLISELVRGETLARLINTRALDDARVLRIGIALADALAHAHARGVIHRDVKPQNVLVPSARESAPHGAHGAAAIAKLTDFGGACLAGDDVLTRTGDVLGTLAYMAPEQCDGGAAGEAADLYSLALIIYEALTGVNPVRGPTAAATARRIGSPIEPLERKRGELPRELPRALDRALRPDPSQRGSLQELRAAFELALAQFTGEARGEEAAEHVHARTRAMPRGSRAGMPMPTWQAAPARRLEAEPVARAQLTAKRGAGEAAREHELAAAARARRRAELPRALWSGCALAAILWQAWVGHPGVALLMLAALAPLELLAPRATSPPERAWIATPWALLAALAPVLGVARLAGAFPAFAGQASRWRMRLAVGALGYWWLTLAEPLLSRRLWLGAPASTPSRAAWESSLSSAAVHVIAPMLSLGVLLGAALWGLGAMCLPWIVRGRRAALDVIAVTMWSAALASAEPLLDHGLAAGGAHANPRGVVLGAVFGAMAAVAVRALRGPV
jgi:eukaryotic-like serine/threonine-protein kinase